MARGREARLAPSLPPLSLSLLLFGVSYFIPRGREREYTKMLGIPQGICRVPPMFACVLARQQVVLAGPPEEVLTSSKATHPAISPGVAVLCCALVVVITGRRVVQLSQVFSPGCYRNYLFVMTYLCSTGREGVLQSWGSIS